MVTAEYASLRLEGHELESHIACCDWELMKTTTENDYSGNVFLASLFECV